MILKNSVIELSRPVKIALGVSNTEEEKPLSCIWKSTHWTLNRQWINRVKAEFRELEERVPISLKSSEDSE